MKPTKLLLLILFPLFFCSCGKQPTPRVLMIADSLINTSPDSAVVFLELWKDSIVSEPKETRMYYQLLSIKAKDKAYIKHTSDSLIQQVLRYYKHRKDRKHLAEALYYAGRVYSDLEDAPQALGYFLQAIEATNGSTDYELMSRIYSQTGTLYLYQDIYDKAPEMFSKAYEYSILAKDSVSMIYDLRDIGRAFSTQEMADSAIYYYKEADKLAERLKNYRLKCVVNRELSGYYTELGKYKEAYKSLHIAFNQIKSHNLPIQYGVAGQYYEYTNQLDSANYYYSKLLLTNDYHYLQKAYRGLGNIARINGDLAQALLYYEKYQAYTDSLNDIKHAETIRKINSLYNYQLHQKENRKLRVLTVYQERWISFFAIAFAFSIISFITYRQHRKRKEQIKQMQQEKFRKIQEEQYNQSLARIEQNKAQIKELELLLHEAEATKNNMRLDLLKAQKGFIEKTNEQIVAKQRVQEQSEINLRSSEVYKKFHRLTQGQNEKLKDTDWDELTRIVDETYSNFTQRLYELYPIKDIEMRVCLLLKIGLSPTQIATITIRSKQAITSIRKRLYNKVFGKDATPEQWDNFILEF